MTVTHMGAWKDCAAAKPWWWSQPMAMWPQPGAVPHQLHLSPSFGSLQLKATLSFEEERTFLPDGESEGDAAGEGHHTQAGQPTSLRLASLCIDFLSSSCKQSPVP